MARDVPHALQNYLDTPGASVLADSSSADAVNVFTDTEDHGLVQRRLALAYGIFAALVFGFWVLAAGFTALAIPARFWELHLSPSKLTHLAGAALLLVACLICRGKPRPRWLLGVIDLVNLLLISSMSAVIVGFAPRGLRAEMMGAIAYVLVVCVRAALVPSVPRWTLLVSAVAAIPVPIGAYLSALHDDTWVEAFAPRSAVLVMSVGWTLAGLTAAWTISTVVYGLRAEVKTAMRLGQYTLEDKLGEGGMGAVYRARHALLRRPTAVKLLSPERAGLPNVRRFEREVQLTSKLTHPNTIAIYDFGHTRSGVFYYAMELIDGLSLQELGEQDGPQRAGRVVHILTQVAGALAEAHDSGLIHRDVKPANILLSARGGLPDFATVCDFGLVKEVDAPGHPSYSGPALSRANAIAGTPLYMAPESIMRPDAIDARVDLYALGGVAYWLLTGQPPFEGASLVEICSHHLHTPPKAPSTRTSNHVPAALDALVLKCLAKKPEARPASARALAAELRAMQDECRWSEDEARLWWATRSARKSQENKAAAGLPQTVRAGEKPSAHRAAI